MLSNPTSLEVFLGGVDPIHVQRCVPEQVFGIFPRFFLGYKILSIPWKCLNHSQNLDDYDTFYVGFYFDRCFVYWWLKLCKWVKETNSIGTCLVMFSFTSQTCSLHIYLLLQHFNNVLKVNASEMLVDSHNVLQYYYNILSMIVSTFC
jgi:hypothetical protein